MKMYQSLALGALLASVSFAALAQDEMPVLPTEVFGCNYVGDSDRGDLDRAFARFNDWADDNGIGNLTSLLLTPQFFSTEREFDVIGMDIWENGASFGSGVSGMMADPDALAGFEGVVECSAHGLYALVGVKPPEQDAPAGGIFEFTDCWIRENRSPDEGVAAIAEFAAMTAGWNVGDAYGALFNIAGETADTDYTFKWLTYYPSYEAFGSVFDHMAAGGVQQAGAIVDPVMHCNSSRMYDMEVMRESQAN